MIKPLNILYNMPKFAAVGAGATPTNPYLTRIPRLALGFVGGALAAVTIAVAVVLPARVDSGGHEPRLQLASQAIQTPPSGADAITSITVVAAREPRSSKSPVRTVEAAPSPGPSGETISSPILRISTAAR